MILPTREFLVVLDPASLEDLLGHSLVGALELVVQLADLNPAIQVHLTFPEYLASGEHAGRAKSARFRFPLLPSPCETEVPALNLSPDIRRRDRERIWRGAEGDRRGLRLLALAAHLKADGVVTTVSSLVEARHQLLQHHRFRVITPKEFPDFVEVCARGHGASCAALPVPTWVAPDVLYQFTHWKGRRLHEWYSRVESRLSDPGLRELLRSALLNRYEFILHARDMVCFYRLQAHHQLRHGRQTPTFRGPLNYHLTAFYVHVWGMLDSLAQMANARLGLGLNPRRCGIDSDDFRQLLLAKQPALRRFVDDHGRQWIALMGDVRHPVAHSALRLQRDLVVETEDSKKSDAEIAAMLRDEDPDLYLQEESRPRATKIMEAVAITQWRLRKMRIISDDVIHVERAGGGYFRTPVASIDFDLEQLNAFIDAFLVACFNGTPADGTTSL